MKKRYPVLFFFSFIAAVAIIFSACRKINDYTDVGGGLIPPIDNINTFDTSIRVQAFNDTFGILTDSLRLISSDQHFLGLINADPIFGKTDAQLFLELKPEQSGFFTSGTYPFARKDSLKLDSVVLVLSYAGRYGDSMVPQTINVYELTQEFKDDSAYLIRQQPLSYGAQLNPGGQIIFPYLLDDSVKAFRDTTAGQLRIKLDTNFARRMMNYDTSNAYRSDSAFTSLFKGFAVKSVSSGNSVIGINLSNSVNTKLAFYYKMPKKSGTFDSSNVTYFTFYSECQSANYVKRDYAGSPVAAAAGQVVEAPIVYIQNSPGTFANIKIPDLPALGNRVVHRAELIVEQVYDISDETFTPPTTLYLDAHDPTVTSSYKYRTIPFSLDFSPNTSSFDLSGFGVSPLNSKDPFGNNIKVWKFNLTRYIQHVVTNNQATYDLRLYSPLVFRGTTRATGSTSDFEINSSYVGKSIVNGRMRVGGGNHPTQKMRLRIVYSKL